MKYISYYFLVFTIISQSGCGYIRDRGRDFADIFSLTITNGVGVVAQASAINTGIGYVGNIAGLEDGAIIEVMGPYIANGARESVVLLGGYFSPEDEIISARNKLNGMILFGSLLPMNPHGGFEITPHYWTKFEIGASMGYGAKFGFNPGELLDFMLGFVIIDIYGDDMNRNGIIIEQRLNQ